jgi:peptidoglycan/xylan/chitin deacetylase (PgdA/CDA1 family)
VKASGIRARLQARYEKTVSILLFRRVLKMRNATPYVSFTFDDFPQSALHVGGEILLQAGLRGTYYVSLELMGREAPPGKMFLYSDIEELLAKGHELGCHTYSHCHSWTTDPKVFEDSIVKNNQVLKELFPEAVLRSFSYPITSPRPGTKRKAGEHFRCCRNGGQTCNTGTTDLNLLRAYFIEKSSQNPSAVKQMIDRNCQARGWLIFATHDVSDTPTRYGCTPSFLKEIVQYSLDSGATILPVAEALDAIIG